MQILCLFWYHTDMLLEFYRSVQFIPYSICNELNFFLSHAHLDVLPHCSLLAENVICRLLVLIPSECVLFFSYSLAHKGHSFQALSLTSAHNVYWTCYVGTTSQLKFALVLSLSCWSSSIFLFIELKLCGPSFLCIYML